MCTSILFTVIWVHSVYHMTKLSLVTKVMLCSLESQDLNEYHPHMLQFTKCSKTCTYGWPSHKFRVNKLCTLDNMAVNVYLNLS